jgi:hypothetical protein
MAHANRRNTMTVPLADDAVYTQRHRYKNATMEGAASGDTEYDIAAWSAEAACANGMSWVGVKSAEEGPTYVSQR